MAAPTVFPAEAIAVPLGSKRKFSEVVDLTSDAGEETAVVAPIISQNGEPQTEPMSSQHVQGDCKGPDSDSDSEDYDDDDDDHEPFIHLDVDDDEDEEEERLAIIDDILDQVEMEPYIPDGSSELSLEEASRLRLQMRQVGLAKLVDDALEKDEPCLKHIAIVLGIPPDLECDDDTLLRILRRAIYRAYMKRGKLTQFNTIDDAANLLKTCNNILVISGAGISTSLGIPDFRSKGTGFYEKIREMGYEDPQDVFDIHSFDENPQTFYSLAGDILPDLKRFTPTHAFIRLLQDQDRLQTNYTQNIDNLEALAGIHPDRLIQCHGSFASASCRKCHLVVKGNEIFDDIRAKRVAYCKACIKELETPRPQKRAKSRRSSSDSDEDDDIPQPGVMKPDITFFGEQLPNTFFERFTKRDVFAADLVIVIGTSLKVAPVSDIPNHLPHAVPHIFISREPIKHIEFDVQLLGNCDDVIFELCRRAGWNMEHEMIPKDFAVDVTPLEGYDHYWFIKPRDQTQQTNHESDATHDTSTPEPRPLPSASSGNSNNVV